jgi:hypothetical protein
MTMKEDHPRFSDEQFMSAEEKEKVLRSWKRFLRSGCAKNQFTEALYHHLSQHCSFIAHFNRHGFYSFYFEDLTTDIFRFFDQFDATRPGISAEYGTTLWLSQYTTGTDLNHAMREAAEPYIDGLRQKFGEMLRQRDLGAASRVLARYGLTAVPTGAPIVVTDMAGQSRRIRPGGDPIQGQLFAEAPIPGVQ